MHNSNIINKEELLMTQLTLFYKDEHNIKQILPIITGSSDISLRLLDWFITNYSKSRNIKYKLENNTDFRVHNDYKAQLKAYSKKQFDPFCRRNRILFYYQLNENVETQYIKTTVGQLNFFRWAIQNNIINYINLNMKQIEEDMIISSKKSSAQKRSESNRIKKKINKHHIDITVSFD